MELKAVVRTGRFWLLTCVQIAASASLGATFYHMVPFFIQVGYSPQHAALLLAATTAVGFPGNLVVGFVVDRFTGTRVLPYVVTALGLSPLLLLGSGHHYWQPFLIPFAILFGISVSVTTAVMPVVIVEAVGLKRFGSISGLFGLAATIGLCGGVMLVGYAFDQTASYSLAFDLSASCAFVGVLAALVAQIVHQERFQPSGLRI
jgi:MFS family permease